MILSLSVSVPINLTQNTKWQLYFCLFICFCLFTCLDSSGLIKIKMARNSVTAGGVMKHSRSKMYSRRAQHKRTKTVTKTEKKAAGAVTEKQVGGAKNGGSRKV